MCIRRFVTPFTKQCFVTVAVSLNLMGHGFEIGFSAVLLSQLKQNQEIPIDDEAASWLASIVGLSIIVGALLVPGIIRKYGRKTSYLLSASIMTTAWFGITMATSIPCLFIMRFMHGISMGMSGFLGYMMIGEYSAPKWRGAFLTTLSFAIRSGIFINHALGAYLSWQSTAFVCGVIGLIDTIMIMWSPETPAYLAMQHRYDECKKAFHWLRGYEEEEELEKMIKRDMINTENQIDNKSIKSMFLNMKRSVKKKEFYKPVSLMVVMYFWSQWSGGIVIDTYINDVIDSVFGKDVNFALTIISLDAQSVVSNTLAIPLIRHFSRRSVLVFSTFVNVGSFFSLGLYIYAKKNNILPFDHICIGMFLIHAYYFSISTGTVPLPNVIAGEITPLKYKEINGMICLLFFSANMILDVKTAPSLFKRIGIDGAFVVYGSLVLCSSLILWGFLPETKDKTLQDIEDELKDSYERVLVKDPKLSLDVESVEALKKFKVSTI